MCVGRQRTQGEGELRKAQTAFPCLLDLEKVKVCGCSLGKSQWLWNRWTVEAWPFRPEALNPGDTCYTALCSAGTKCFGKGDEVWSLLVGSSGGRNPRQLITVPLQSIGRMAEGIGSVHSEAFIQSRTPGHRTLLPSDKVSSPVSNNLTSHSHALRFFS